MIVYQAKNFRTELVDSAIIYESGGRFHLSVKGKYGDYQSSYANLEKAKRDYSSNYGGGAGRVKWEKMP